MSVLSRAKQPRRAAPAPVETDVATALVVGTTLWAVALVGLLPFWGWLQTNDHLWWLGVCVVGIVLGLAGLPSSRRRQAAARAEQVPKDPSGAARVPDADARTAPSPDDAAA